MHWIMETMSHIQIGTSNAHVNNKRGSKPKLTITRILIKTRTIKVTKSNIESEINVTFGFALIEC